MDNNKKKLKKLVNKNSAKGENTHLRNLKDFIEIKKSQNKVLKKIIKNLTDNKNK